ncbi:MAG: AAA family ATPase [Gemmataceae bacterium]
MIQQVSIKNFKCLRDVTVNLERFTVFVGANGSGKTSILSAVHNAVRAATGDPQKVFSHERHGDWVYTRGGLGDLSINCRTEGGEFRVEATPPEGYPPEPEFLQKGLWQYRILPQGAALQTALDPARRMVFLQLNARELAKPSYSEQNPPRMEYNGEGLGSVLAYMALNTPETFAELVEIARGLIPGLKRIRFRKAAVPRIETEMIRIGPDTIERRSRRNFQGELILLDFEHAANVSARAASEGTMLILGLLAVVLGPTRPSVLLMDDIEHGLHPLAQEKLVESINGLQHRFPDLQLLVTSHSPYLLDYLHPEQVRIVAAGSDGNALCRRLSDHPKYDKWKGEFHPGEMWSVFGEKWIGQSPHDNGDGRGLGSGAGYGDGGGYGGGSGSGAGFGDGSG